MEYKEFVCAVEKRMNRNLKGGVKASLYTAVKNNGRERRGILVESPGINVSPTIYLEEFYQRFQKGESMDIIIRDVLNFYDMVKYEKPLDVSCIDRYEAVRDKVVFKIVNTEQNRMLLEQVPHMELLDLSIVFYALLAVSREGTATMLINNEHLLQWKVSINLLYEEACKNVKRLLPAQLFTMQYAIDEILDPFSENQENLFEKKEGAEDVMYVLSNPLRSFGAACMAYPEVLSMAGDLLEENFYVLPSSVHEVILMPESKALEQSELDEMVTEINETQVAEEEILSGHTYYYERDSKRLVMRQYMCC